MLIDFSAAFDTIDHNTHIAYLKSWFGLSRTVFKWFVSYLSNRCQAIKIGLTLSEQNNNLPIMFLLSRFLKVIPYLFIECLLGGLGCIINSFILFIYVLFQK